MKKKKKMTLTSSNCVNKLERINVIMPLRKWILIVIVIEYRKKINKKYIILDQSFSSFPIKWPSFLLLFYKIFH